MNINESKNIILVSHCMLNKNSKVKSFYNNYIKEELRKDVIKQMIEKDYGIIQLPCPEQIIYGCKRWGHLKNQFDTPHFREVCRTEFKPVLDQLVDYINNGYEIVGLIGIDGSPSCGVNLTCTGNWGGEISNNPIFENINDSILYTKDKGILMEEIQSMLLSNNIVIDMIGFREENIEEIYKMIE